jgi:multidrug efflux pump subunit AcrA (membrane-fusion protein)
MKKVIIFIVVLVLGLGAAAAYQIHKRLNQPKVEDIEKYHLKEGVPVRIFTVEAMDLERKVSVSGSIEAYQSVDIASQVSERIETIHVQTGQKVAKNDLLVTLDAANAKLTVAQAEASLAQAKEQLLKLQNGSRPEEIEAARAARDEAQAMLNLQKLEVERYQGLYQEEAATLQQLQTVENQYKRWQAALEAAQANYELIKKGPREEDIALAKAQVSQAEVAQAQAQEGLGDHYLRAPFAGVVTVRHFEPGALVDFNQPIFSLLQTDPVYLVVKISEIYIPSVTVGMPVEVQIDALASLNFTGKVAEINPKAEESGRSFITKILVENPQGELRPGLFGRAQITVEKITGGLVVPTDAIQEEGETKFVWLVDENQTCQQREVTLGATFQESVQVVSGLNEGDRVITLAQSILKSGIKVVMLDEAK